VLLLSGDMETSRGVRPVERSGRLTVIGGASLDTLHLTTGAHEVAGGAGLYTALAARRAGAEVTMLAPRPAPVPHQLATAAGVIDWRGPEVGRDGIPHFDISYDAGGRRHLRIDSAGDEGTLEPHRIAADLAPGPVYVVPLTNTRLQLEFVRELRTRGRWVACGTYPCGAREDTEAVRAVFESADAFFCNDEEAESLFGSVDAAMTVPGKLLFVTLGDRGVRVIQGTCATDIAAAPAVQIDPTGAGDALCGGTLAALARGEHPVEAARRGAAVAAQLVTGIGPAALLSEGTPPVYPEDDRLALCGERIEQISNWLAGARQVAGFDFCGDAFPERNHPGALDFFFSQTLQQFGFWIAEDRGYREPMIAVVGGMPRKGSDYLWYVYRRLLEEDPDALTPSRQQFAARSELDFWYRADDEGNPVPASELHLEVAHSYGSDMVELGTSPEAMLAQANDDPRPVAALLGLLDHVGGYKEDPLRKKSALLALVLRQRPERYLRRESDEDLPPIVDYHIQRSCLRMGLVRVEDDDLRCRLTERRMLPAGDEEAVRRASYRAVEQVRMRSGRSMAEVDWFFFQNRRRCPEMTEPECSRCEVESVCARAKELFQPVHRTTFY
jgi:sugar/nucleoside kinase (ribokinase family)